jgi:RimJ/RimL family protein N-acetyltransferase
MNLFDKIQNLKIIGKKVILDDITDKDKYIYYDLYTNDNLNKFWGYDYKEDAPKNPTPDYFLDFCNVLKIAQEEYSYAIRLNGKMIGEFVLHNFKENSFEIGFRVLVDYQGKGYVKDAVTSFIEFMKKNIKPDFIKAKCFKQNISSNNLLSKCGFKNYISDDTYNYFIIKTNKLRAD